MVTKVSPQIAALLFDALILTISGICGADLYSWQALSFLLALFVWRYVAFLQNYSFTSYSILKTVFIFSVTVAIRSSVMSWFHSVGTTHSLILIFPALLVASIAFFSLTYSLKRDVTVTSWIFISAMLITIIRLFYLGKIEALPEEGYYWNYATHFAPGYIDHPPMVGVLIRIGLFLFGTNEFALRFVGFVTSLCSAFVITLLVEKIYPSASLKERYLAGALSLLCPYLMGTGLLISPDAMLVLCWLSLLYFMYSALIEGKHTSWYWIGIFGGLGMLSKYTIVLLGIPIALFMLIDKDARVLWKRKEPYIAILLAFIIFSPVIYWNITNGFASFAFQSTRRVAAPSEFYLHRLVLDMMILVLPVTLFAGFYSLSILTNNRVRLLSLLSIVCPTALFVFYSITHETKLNWTGPGLMLLVPFTAHFIYSSYEELPSMLRRLHKAFIPTVASLVILLSISFQFLGFGLPLIPYGESLHRILGWESLTKSVIDQAESFKVTTNKIPVIVAMDKHFIASNFSFYAQKIFSNHSPYEVGSRNIIGEGALMWNFWSPAEGFIGSDIILIARNESDLSDERVSRFFDSLEPIEKKELETRGRKTKGYFTRIGHRYLGIVDPNKNSEKTIEKEKGDELTSSPSLPSKQEQENLQFTPAPLELNRS
jgi:dolichol-phosphate mannosyltransferase